MASTPNLRSILMISLATILLIGCAGATNTQLPSPAFATVTKTASEVKPELEKYFQGFTGAFVMYDLNNDHTIRYQPEGAAERLLPASTFKIMNALIGLETGTIPDENFVIKWDGTQYENPAWNQDHTLKTAMQNSVVWYYQEVTRRVGMQKMQKYLLSANYGNKDISGQIDSFWLLGGIKISDDEQVMFLKKLYQGDLPFSKRSINIVKKIIVLDKTETYRLSGKTGTGQMGVRNLGRFVGYLEVNDNVYFFATHLESPRADANGVKAREITSNILKSFGLLP
ncbi:MAG TPA: class D beta-lactamase [Anaerolineales bacterium]|jgi:beta-lactamase class D